MSRVTDSTVAPPMVAPPMDPDNPWRRGEAIGMQPAPDRPRRPDHDPEANGLDAPLLDDLLKARMTEGMDVGRARGIALAESRFPQIHDNGYAVGRRAGWESGYSKASAELKPVMHGVQRELQALRRLSRGKEIQARLDAQIAELSYALGQALRPSPV